MSDFKNILVHLDDRESTAKRLELCLGFAQRFDARVTGLYVGTVLAQNLLVDAPPSGMLIEALEAEQRERTQRARTLFEQTTGAAGVPCEFHAEQGAAVQWLTSYAGLADLVVAGQPGDQEVPGTGGIAGDVVLGCGRPVLVVPRARAATLSADRVMVAWNGSREAARAVADALPFLKAASTVEVVSVAARDDRGGTRTDDRNLCRHLRRHGVEARRTALPRTEVDAPEMLLSHAAASGAEIIVLGAYGHSRFRELVLGGVTRHLLNHSAVPLLLSH